MARAARKGCPSFSRLLFYDEMRVSSRLSLESEPVIMPPSIAVIAPGAMGSAIAARLVEHGCKVLTSLDGRSEATRKRAAAAGMVGAGDGEIANADIILSIVPPGEAVA